MEFFDKLGKKATEAYRATADKTGKIARETKIKLRVGELKTQINDIYEEIGKKVYEKHTREEDISIKNDLEEQCTKIDVLSDEIESLLKECLELKDKKQCSNCYKEIEKEVKFCPNCGAKQEEQEEQEEQEKQEENKEQVDEEQEHNTEKIDEISENEKNAELETEIQEQKEESTEETEKE